MVVQPIAKNVTGDELSKVGSEREYISFRDVWAFLRKYALFLLAFAAVGGFVGVIYVWNTKSTYLATTRLVMDPEQGRVSWQDVATGTIIIEAAEIASQVEIVKSEAVAESVIKKLGLTEDPELLESKSWQSRIRDVVGGVTGMFSGETPDELPGTVNPEEEIMRRTMAAFLSRVSVQRVGQSYVLEIGYLSNDAEKSARVANALANAYIRVGMNDRAEMAKSGAKWLESRLMDVGRKAREASLEAESFRSKNNITVVGNQATLDQQQLSEVSTQLLNAKAVTAAESSKLSALRQALGGDQPDEHFTDVSFNNQIDKLRDDIRVAETKLESLKSRYHEGNPAIVATEAEIARTREALQNEFRRIEKVYESNLEAAMTREKLAEKQLEQLTGTTAAKNTAVAELAEIESRANTYRRIYESLLQQLVGTTQTQSFPLGKARIVTAATPPLSKIWPKTSIILPFSSSLGLLIGVLAAVLHQNVNHRANSSEHLRRELGINSLGHVPMFKPVRGARSVAADTNRTVAPLRGVLAAPYSDFSEALRGVKNSLDSIFPENASMAVGITSVGQGEGKTTVAVNLAQLYRNEGRSVLLVDADFVNSRLSRMMVTFPQDLALEALPETELLEASEEVPLRYVRKGEVFAGVKASHSTVLPVSEREQIDDGHGSVPVFSIAQIMERKSPNQNYGHLPALRKGIETLRKHYEIIIVDLSAFETSADTRSICTYLDGIVMVLGKSSTMTIDRLSSALATFGRSRVALLGLISNRSSR